jgi:muramoyltetrapeptide carboxypeptidase
LTVGVFRSGSKIDESLLEQGKAKFKEISDLEIREFEIKKNNTVYFSGNSVQRSDSFLKVYEDKNIEFLWAARGGYGTIEILNQLSTQGKEWSGKKIIGYSDVTALHSFLSNISIASYHAPMIATQKWSESADKPLESMSNLFKGKSLLPIPVESDSNTKGRIVGGNLSVLASLMGTPWQLKLQKGDILLLEDINEPYYALARSLKQLSYSPNFYECSLCWGELTQCGKDFKSEHELIVALSDPYGLKNRMGLQVGHGNVNYCLRLGANVTIDGQLLYCD